jgi:ABC-2 type transport system ATP-binding protein
MYTGNDMAGATLADGGASRCAGQAALLKATNVLLTRAGDFSLRIPHLGLHAGEMLVLLGANGSGKSTLLSCLMGAERAEHGEIDVLGAAPDCLRPAQRQHLGVQWQGAGYNELYRVGELRTLHRLSYARSDAAVFEALGVPELSNRRYGLLSSGEQQRVHLALALAHHPQLAIFDEPTSNLDPRYEAHFCQLLRQRHQPGSGQASLCITHSASVAQQAQRVLVLRKGAIDRLGTLEILVLDRFGTVGCRVAGSTAQLDAARQHLGASARLSRGEAGALTLYGDAALREAAQELARQHEFEHFALWRPGAADLLESIKHD